MFKTPTSQLRVLDRDLKAAGIAKRDDRGRTLDIHALRCTFGTHLSRASVPLRTAQAAMRHSSPVLTANVYTDPRLLDIHGAVESLPAMTSTGATQNKAESLQATRTDSDGTKKFPPLFPPNTGDRGETVSFPVTSGKRDSFNSEQNPESKTDEKPTKKARILIEKDSGRQSGRHDLNMRLPAPKAGGNVHETNENGRFQKPTLKVSASVGPCTLKVVSESKPEPAVKRARKRRTNAAVETINGATDDAMKGDFAAALMMIATLPLSDAEKAEAVRRLLSSGKGGESL